VDFFETGEILWSKATSKKVSSSDCDNDRQPKSNMAAHTGNIYMCGDIIWGQLSLGQINQKL